LEDVQRSIRPVDASAFATVGVFDQRHLCVTIYFSFQSNGAIAQAGALVKRPPKAIALKGQRKAIADYSVKSPV